MHAQYTRTHAQYTQVYIYSISKVLSAKRLEYFYGLSLLLANHPQISRKQLSLEGMHHKMDTGHLTAIQVA